MRFLILHVNSFCCTITEKGRSKVFEPYQDPVTRVEDALLVLSSIEKGDERQPALVAQRTSGEIAKFASQLKVTTVVGLLLVGLTRYRSMRKGIRYHG